MKQKFHAHIYFELSQKPVAEALYWAIQTLLIPRVRLGQLHLEPVGPHSLPMFTVMFEERSKKEFIQFLDRNRETLSVLIHEDTGDDYRDHTVGAEWLGKKQFINFDHFERIKHEKSALVFPEP